MAASNYNQQTEAAPQGISYSHPFLNTSPIGFTSGFPNALSAFGGMAAPHIPYVQQPLYTGLGGGNHVVQGQQPFFPHYGGLAQGFASNQSKHNLVNVCNVCT